MLQTIYQTVNFMKLGKILKLSVTILFLYAVDREYFSVQK
jgi:hypothetical protein